MLDINKLRVAYNVVHRLSQNKNPLAEEELTLAVVQSVQVQEALADAAETIAAYGKIMNIVAQSTSFSVAKTVSREPKIAFAITQEEIAKMQPMSAAPNITSLVKYINDSLAHEDMHKLTTVELGRWLMHNGYLQIPGDGRNKIPTEMGAELGITTEKRVRQSTGETYYINFYSPEAQQFIFNSLPAVADFLVKEKADKNTAVQEKSTETEN